MEDPIVVMVLKGTPSTEPDTPPAYTPCQACGAELVYDARLKQFYEQQKARPHCIECAIKAFDVSAVANMGGPAN